MVTERADQAVHKALIVIDMQVGVSPLYHGDDVRSRIRERVDTFHRANKPVIFVQHTDEDLPLGSPQWQLVAGLGQQPSDFYVRKTHADSFYHTNLTDVLTSVDARTIEICGAEIPYCLDATIKAAFDREYHIELAHGTVSMTEPVGQSIPTKLLVEHYHQVWNGRFVTYIED